MSETNIIDMFNKAFEKIELFYAPLDEQLLETFKRLGYGVIKLKESEEATVVIIKQLSWQMTNEESLETVKSVFKAFECELYYDAEDCNMYVYCEKISEDMYKLSFTNQRLEIDIWNDNLIYCSE